MIFTTPIYIFHYIVCILFSSIISHIMSSHPR
nr:MAG TPA: hypothetical protein [Caudoviricetes sp.]